MTTTNYVLPTRSADREAATYLNFDFAVVCIDDQARERLARFKRVRSQVDLQLGEGTWTELVWSDYSARYYTFYLDPISDDLEAGSFADRLDQALADSEVIAATDEELDYFRKAGELSTGTGKIHVCHTGVYWTCNPRCVDALFTTGSLSWEQLGIE